MDNKALIEKFYTSFSNKDADGMISCYHPEIEFEDPAFGKLKGERAKNMWRMLLSNEKANLKIEFDSVTANEKTGSANWTARYKFGKAGRLVVNKIQANFEFKEGKIIKHVDEFNLHTWAKQAFGISGLLLGWTQFFQKKVRSKANQSLDKFVGRL